MLVAPGEPALTPPRETPALARAKSGMIPKATQGWSATSSRVTGGIASRRAWPMRSRAERS